MLNPHLSLLFFSSPLTSSCLLYASLSAGSITSVVLRHHLYHSVLGQGCGLDWHDVSVAAAGASDLTAEDWIRQLIVSSSWYTQWWERWTKLEANTSFLTLSEEYLCVCMCVCSFVFGGRGWTLHACGWMCLYQGECVCETKSLICSDKTLSWLLCSKWCRIEDMVESFREDNRKPLVF